MNANVIKLLWFILLTGQIAFPLQMLWNKKGHSSNTSVVSAAHVCVRWTLQLSHFIKVSTLIRIKMEQVFVKRENGPMLTLLAQKRLYSVVEFITVTYNNNLI